MNKKEILDQNTTLVVNRFKNYSNNIYINKKIRDLVIAYVEEYKKANKSTSVTKNNLNIDISGEDEHTSEKLVSKSEYIELKNKYDKLKSEYELLEIEADQIKSDSKQTKRKIEQIKNVLDFEFPNKKKSFGSILNPSDNKTLSCDVVLINESVSNNSLDSSKVEDSEKIHEKTPEKIFNESNITEFDSNISELESNISELDPNKNLEPMRKTKSMKVAMLTSRILSPSSFVKEPNNILLEMSKHYGIKRSNHEHMLRQNIDCTKPNSHNYIANSPNICNNSSQYNYECWKANQIQNKYPHQLPQSYSQSQSQSEHNHDYSFIDVGISRIGPSIPYPNNYYNNNIVCDDYAVPMYINPNKLFNR